MTEGHIVGRRRGWRADKTDWQADRNVDAKLRNRPEMLFFLTVLGIALITIIIAALHFTGR